jgi:hypothetical protein
LVVQVVARTRVALIVVVIAGLLVAAGCGPDSAAAGRPRSVAPAKVGFSTDGFFEWENDADLNRDLDATAATGVQWVRLSFDWSKLQRTQSGPLDWSMEDRLVRAAQARHLKILGLMTYTPTWARQPGCRGGDKCPPRNPAEFAAFAAQIVFHYAPWGIHAWEIWNEPNNPDFWSAPINAADYVALLKPTAAAIHRLDRLATVVSGGLAPHGDLGRDPSDVRSPVNYVKAMYRAGVRGSLDAVGHHPYPPLPYSPLSGKAGWNAVMQTVTIHDVMASYGDATKQVWGTEFGAPTGTTSMGVSELAQAQYLTDEIQQWSAWTFTGPLFVHMIRDRSYDRTDWGYDLGVMRANGRPKPAYIALQSLLRG